MVLWLYSASALAALFVLPFSVRALKWSIVRYRKAGSRDRLACASIHGSAMGFFFAVSAFFFATSEIATYLFDEASEWVALANPFIIMGLSFGVHFLNSHSHFWPRRYWVAQLVLALGFIIAGVVK